jgi:hypothetical protein
MGLDRGTGGQVSTGRDEKIVAGTCHHAADSLLQRMRAPLFAWQLPLLGGSLGSTSKTGLCKRCIAQSRSLRLSASSDGPKATQQGRMAGLSIAMYANATGATAQQGRGRLRGKGRWGRWGGGRWGGGRWEKVTLPTSCPVAAGMLGFRVDTTWPFCGAQ